MTASNESIELPVLVKKEYIMDLALMLGVHEYAVLLGNGVTLHEFQREIMFL